MAAVLVPAVASAEYTQYHYGNIPSGVRIGDVTRSALTSSLGMADISSHKIRAGAHYPGGLTLFASWAESYNIACHNYGQEPIGAMIENPHTVSMNPVIGGAGWVKNGVGTYC